jgi:hypothetical protein
LRRAHARPRIDKREKGHRLRGSPIFPSDKVVDVRFVGIDIGAERHVIAVVNASGDVVAKPVHCAEDAEGYRRLLEIAGPPDDALVAMEG